ncbi:MAG: hypothetical protein IPJ32_00380 [Sphingobacteriaceae bacterium]|nr:hypothetical protein [Sphingobacteriaceae bacterium]
MDHELKMSQQIAAMVNAADVEQHSVIDELNEKCKAYFKNLNTLKIRDWLVNPHHKSKSKLAALFVRTILLFVFSPLWIRGLLGNYLPYKSSEKLLIKWCVMLNSIRRLTWLSALF